MNEFKNLSRMCVWYSKSAILCQHACEMSSLNNGTGRDCYQFLKKYPSEAAKIVNDWAKEHPVKTRKDLLLEKFPNATIQECGRRGVCPKDLGLETDIGCANATCSECWNVEVEHE